MTLPIAVDVMGGDRGPGEIVAGACQAGAELGVPLLLVGQRSVIEKALADAAAPCELDVLDASEVIGMDEDPAQGVRRKKDSSLVRAAEAVRDGRATAMVSAGNTGATMASALLRMGRLAGVQRPAIAIPIPVPGSTPTVLLDAGANAECAVENLVQFAQMGSVYAAYRYGIDAPRVGLLSIGEEPTKGTPLVKEAHARLVAARAGLTFIGNVEGRDLMTDAVDVVVTDGFTGNVVLKVLEGAMTSLMKTVMAVLPGEARASLRPLALQLHPDTYGGAVLLGVQGVCIISHGSSKAIAIASAVRVATEMVDSGLIETLQKTVKTTS